MCEAKTAYPIYASSSGGAGCGGNACGPFHTLGEQNETAGTKGNITGQAAVASTRYFLDAHGNFARERNLRDRYQSETCTMRSRAVPRSAAGTKPPETKAATRMPPSQLVCFSPRSG